MTFGGFCKIIQNRVNRDSLWIMGKILPTENLSQIFFRSDLALNSYFLFKLEGLFQTLNYAH